YTFEIDERIGSEGEIVAPMSDAQVREVIATLYARGFEAIAVSLLWSIANPAHELRIGQLLEELMPGVPYT
ncbi:hydantoinase/oxoprolinase N-terminal domain-containing protein, partial [Salmonella enterica]|uniref:hydantoinase/oxoprolinase N-terminal domain-containing protein n=1 Tax=Salmonella enterica TaxID=28901 RepID=UPI003CFAC791